MLGPPDAICLSNSLKQHWDVIVIGLGGVGSAAALHLASRGLRVLGIDQFAPAHDLGSSHGQTRVIRQAYFEHPDYVPLLKRAYELWDELERDARQQLFFRTGLLEVGPPDGVVIPGVLESAQRHGLEIETMRFDEARHRWPSLQSGDPTWHAIVESNAGYLLVEDCVSANLRLAVERGATLMHHTAVVDWQRDGKRLVVNTSATEKSGEHAEYFADRLLVAAGPWQAKMLKPYGVNLKLLRKYQYWFDIADHDLDQANGFPCFFFEVPQGYYYGFPNIDSSGVKVARHSGGRLVNDAATPKSDVDEEDLSLVRDFTENHISGITSALKRQAGCFYTVTPDEHFIVDRIPDAPSVTVVAGLSGHGFKFTSALGELAADLVVNQSAKAPEIFRLGRLV